MSRGFPPSPTHTREITIMLDVFASVIEDHRAIYVASPFTTGRRASRWLNENGVIDSEVQLSNASFRARVVEQNKARAGAFVHGLRAQRSVPVIAPTELPDIQGWTQSDYHFFWGQVIEKYIETVVFLNDWEYSSGCAYEFFVAQRTRVPTVREDLTPLTRRAGEALLDEAIREASKAGHPSGFVLMVRDALQYLDPEGGL